MRPFTVRQLTTEIERSVAVQLEVEIFGASGLVELDEYAKYESQSTFFGGFDDEGSCVGLVRVIEGSPIAPPFLAHGVDITAGKQQWIELGQINGVVELGTAAIHPDYRVTPLFFNLVRHAYRFINERGIRYCAMITEPERAKACERLFLLPSYQIGPDQHYMGEKQITAPFVFDFHFINEYLRTNHPAHAEWLLDSPLENFGLHALRN